MRSSLLNALATLGIPKEAVRAPGGLPRSVAAAVFAESSVLIYIADENEIHGDDSLQHLRRKLVCRGQGQYLGLFKGEAFHLHLLHLDPPVTNAVAVVATGSSDAKLLYSRLLHGDLARKRVPSRWAFRPTLTRLLDAATAVPASGVDRSRDDAQHDALPLVVRALVLRILEGLGITGVPTAGSDPLAAMQWLDRAFHVGLPLPAELDAASWEAVAPIVLSASNTIGPQPGDFSLDDGMPTALQSVAKEAADWADLDFASIRPEVLAEYLDARLDHRRGITRTPTDEVYLDLITRNAIDGAGDARQGATVLDPACGCGRLLLSALDYQLALREPGDGALTTEAIWDVVRRQIHGLDLNPVALAFAQMLLMVKALSRAVDRNLGALTPLLGVSLFRPTSDTPTPVQQMAGSLGRWPSYRRHRHAYDVVACDPPSDRPALWSGPAFATAAERRVRRRCAAVVLQSIESSAAAVVGDVKLGWQRFNPYEHPSRDLGLAFFWQAREWCKPDGTIAMVVNKRWLLDHSAIATKARRWLLRSLSLTTVVLPQSASPVSIAFAHNQAPHHLGLLRCALPSVQRRAGDLTHLQFEPRSIHSIRRLAALQDPMLFTTLASVGRLGADLIRDLIYPHAHAWRRQLQPLGVYWERDLGLAASDGMRRSAVVAQPATGEVVPRADQGRRDAISAMNAKFKGPGGPIADTARYAPVVLDLIQRARDPAAFQAPLVSLEKAMPAYRQLRATLVLTDPVIYDDRDAGFSAAASSDPAIAVELTQYLWLVLNSSWAGFILRATANGSGGLTVTRTLPIIPLRDLSETERAQLRQLSEVPDHGDPNSRSAEWWASLDDLVFELYATSPADRDLVTESLKKMANQPGSVTPEIFGGLVQDFLASVAPTPQLTTAAPQRIGPWTVFHWAHGPPVTASRDLLVQAITDATAAQPAASTHFLWHSPGQVHVALLERSGALTRTEAREIARALFDRYGSDLGGPVS